MRSFAPIFGLHRGDHLVGDDRLGHRRLLLLSFWIRCSGLPSALGLD